MPERVDLERLREEAVAAEIEPVAVDLDRLRQAADLILGLEHEHVATGLAEQIARREARRPGPKDEQRWIGLDRHKRKVRAGPREDISGRGDTRTPASA